jgi:hypothetical protein
MPVVPYCGMALFLSFFFFFFGLLFFLKKKKKKKLSQVDKVRSPDLALKPRLLKKLKNEGRATNWEEFRSGVLGTDPGRGRGSDFCFSEQTQNSRAQQERGGTRKRESPRKKKKKRIFLKKRKEKKKMKSPHTLHIFWGVPYVYRMKRVL